MKPLRDSDRQALLTLLADDDQQMLELLEQQFASMGAVGSEFLESAIRTASPRASQTAARMLGGIRDHRAEQAFLEFCRDCPNDLDLEEASWLLAKPRYPELDEAPSRVRLDQMARELRERLTGRETPRA